MDKRYPGSPHEAGEMHPVLLNLDDSPVGQIAHAKAAEEALAILRDAFKEWDNLGTPRQMKDLSDVPAIDRIGDLLILGYLVEKGIPLEQFYVTP